MAIASPPTSGNLEHDLSLRLREDGVVILPELLPEEFVAELRDGFGPLIDAYVGGAPPNRGANRHQMYLPFEPPFSNPMLWANPTVLAVLEGVLGPNFECTYFGSDTPYPGSDNQPIHQDGGPLFPEWESRPPIYCVALNVPLVDVDDDNGPLEWFADPERPGADSVPNRFTAPAGSMLLRDTRVWHRGSPNNSDQPRPMLGLLYTRSWYRFPLARPAIDRSVFERLPDLGRQLFGGADIMPVERTSGDQPRLGRNKT